MCTPGNTLPTAAGNHTDNYSNILYPRSIYYTLHGTQVHTGRQFVTDIHKHKNFNILASDDVISKLVILKHLCTGI